MHDVDTILGRGKVDELVDRSNLADGFGKVLVEASCGVGISFEAPNYLEPGLFGSR